MGQLGCPILNLNTGLSLKKMRELRIGRVHCRHDYDPHEPGSDRRYTAVDVHFARKVGVRQIFGSDPGASRELARSEPGAGDGDVAGAYSE